MAATVSRLPRFIPVFLILLPTLYASSEGISFFDHRTILSGGGGGVSNRSLLGIRRNNPMAVKDCSDMATQSQCSQKSNKCRWCRSEALDDMCFSKSEAWRLPHQTGNGRKLNLVVSAYEVRMTNDG